jgi:hypothetical protein
LAKLAAAFTASRPTTSKPGGLELGGHAGVKLVGDLLAERVVHALEEIPGADRGLGAAAFADLPGDRRRALVALQLELNLEGGEGHALHALQRFQLVQLEVVLREGFRRGLEFERDGLLLGELGDFAEKAGGLGGGSQEQSGGGAGNEATENDVLHAAIQPCRRLAPRYVTLRRGSVPKGVSSLDCGRSGHQPSGQRTRPSASTTSRACPRTAARGRGP